MENKKAFTLAELLISLSIIGVIAALTLPTLITQTEIKTNARVYKKTVATLNDLVAQSVTDSRFQPYPVCFYWDENPYGTAKCVQWSSNGECSKYEYEDGSSLASDHNGPMSQCNALFSYMKENLKVTKECSSNNAFSGGCTPEYNGNDTNAKNNNPDATDYDVTKSTSGCANWRKENLKKRNAYVLADGTILILYGTGAQLLAVDTNGKRGPNKWGFDVWPMILKGNKGDIPVYKPGGCEFVEKGGISPSTILKDNY